MRNENETIEDLLIKRDSTIIRSELEGLVLDVGCGNGSVTYKHPFVVGIDIRPQPCKIPLIVGDMHHLPFRSNTFDVTIFCHTLEHTPHPSTALDETYRVIKDDGKIVVSVPNARYILWPYYLVRHQFIYAKEHKSVFTFTSLKTLLEKKGFTVTKLFTSGGVSSKSFIPLVAVLIQKLIKKGILLQVTDKLSSLHPSFSYEVIIVAYKNPKEVCKTRYARPQIKLVKAC